PAIRYTGEPVDCRSDGASCGIIVRSGEGLLEVLPRFVRPSFAPANECQASCGINMSGRKTLDLPPAGFGLNETSCVCRNPSEQGVRVNEIRVPGDSVLRNPQCLIEPPVTTQRIAKVQEHQAGRVAREPLAQATYLGSRNTGATGGVHV